MLKDIVTITIETFNEAFCTDKILSRPKRVYDVYRNLQELISNVSLVANHYLALDFTEHFLENSSLYCSFLTSKTSYKDFLISPAYNKGFLV